MEAGAGIRHTASMTLPWKSLDFHGSTSDFHVEAVLSFHGSQKRLPWKFVPYVKWCRLPDAFDIFGSGMRLGGEKVHHTGR